MRAQQAVDIRARSPGLGRAARRRSTSASI